MLDHVSFAVADTERSRAFYAAALAPLGIELLMSVTPEQTGGGSAFGFGEDDRAYFWIGDGPHAVQGSHVAFAASSQAVVKAFYDAALAAGGTDNGVPGPRPEYGPNYYAAFVRDPDGINVEAVFRG